MLKGRKICALFFAVVLSVLMGFTASAEEKAIESITIEKITLIENSDGYYDAQEDYFWYNSTDITDVTVNYTDGTAEVMELYDLEMEYYEFFEFDDGQSASSPWTIGTYTVSYTFMGIEGQYEVEIIESPVERIIVEPLELCYMGDGFADEYITDGQFYYNTAPEKMTVYYKDGRIISSSTDGLCELTGYAVTVDDGQEDKAWGIGKYKCTAEFMGATADFSVTVKESPVKKIQVENVTLYEGIDGMGGDIFDEDDFTYSAKPEKVTVYYKDGTAFTGSPEEIEEATGYEVSYDEWMQWDYGNHTATASYLGASTKFTVTVKPYPISRVELVSAPVKTEYYSGEYIDLTGAVIKVYYTDGKTEEIKLSQSYTGELYDLSFRLEKIGKTAVISASEFASVYNSGAFFDVFNSNFTVNYTVKGKTITDIELSADSNGFPTLEFVFSDNSVEKAVIYDLAGENPEKYEDGYLSSAIIFTKVGVFETMIERKDDSYSLIFMFDEPAGEIVTDFCDDINWGAISLTEKAEIIYNNNGGADAYKGLVATDNIDDLVAFAAAGSNAGKPTEIYSDYYIYTATEIQKSVKDFFSLDGIDISCSKNYNSVNNTIKIKRFENVLWHSQEQKVCHPVSYTVSDGYITAEYVFGDGKKMSISADSQGRVVSYKVLNPVIHKHIMVTVAGVQPTYLKTGLSDGVICSTCGEVLTQQKVIDKLVLGKTSKFVSEQTTDALKITWAKVTGATGYELFYKTAAGWKNVSTTTATSETFRNLPSGKKYTFAVRAYVIENGKVIKAKEYTTFEASTAAKAPAKVVSKQTTTALQLQWAKSAGATGYKIYYKTATGWKSPGHTTNTVATFKNLTPGSKFTFAIRPYIITADTVVWGEIAYYTAATNPTAPAVAVASQAKGTITLKFGSVRGAEAYCIYYKKGNGSYTLYKSYATAGTLNFRNLKSGDSYTFVVRSATKTSGGWIYSSYTPKTVKVK